MTGFLPRALLLTSVMLGLAPAHAALHDRGCGLVYDDVLNVTWLQNVTLAAGSPYDDDYLEVSIT